MFNIAVLSLFLVLYLPWSFGSSIEQVTQTYQVVDSVTWDERKNVLYFLDTLSGYVHRLQPHNNITTSIPSPEEEAGSISLIEGKDQEFIVGANETLYKLNWDGNTNKTFTALGKVNNDSSTILGYAVVDPRGRLLTSTYGLNRTNQMPIEKSGALYSIQFQQDKVPQPQKRMSSLTFLYGFGFRKGYLFSADSAAGKVFKTAYNLRNGRLGARKTVFTLAEHWLKGFVYGMAFDTENNLWISLYEGRKIIRINPWTSDLLLEYDLPFRYPTALAFGGVNLTTLYVGSSSIFEQQLNTGAGALFAIHGLGVTGVQLNKIIISK